MKLIVRDVHGRHAGVLLRRIWKVLDCPMRRHRFRTGRSQNSDECKNPRGNCFLLCDLDLLTPK